MLKVPAALNPKFVEQRRKRLESLRDELLGGERDRHLKAFMIVSNCTLSD
jgi:hypothetical protein